MPLIGAGILAAVLVAFIVYGRLPETRRDAIKGRLFGWRCEGYLLQECPSWCARQLVDQGCLPGTGDCIRDGVIQTCAAPY